MCLNHKTYHSCDHNSTDITLCFASIAPIIHRATTFPYAQAIPTVPMASHEVVTTTGKSSSWCASCLRSPSPWWPGQNIPTKDSSFFQDSGAANSDKSSNTLLNSILAEGTTLHLEGDETWDNELRQMVCGTKTDGLDVASPAIRAGNDEICTEYSLASAIAETYERDGTNAQSSSPASSEVQKENRKLPSKATDPSIDREATSEKRRALAKI